MNYIIIEIVITVFIVFFICNSIVIFIVCFYSFIGFVFTEFMVLFLFCLNKRKLFNESYCITSRHNPLLAVYRNKSKCT